MRIALLSLRYLICVSVCMYIYRIDNCKTAPMQWCDHCLTCFHFKTEQLALPKKKLSWGRRLLRGLNKKKRISLTQPAGIVTGNEIKLKILRYFRKKTKTSRT